ncbi:MAG TPA: bifunctional diguanylate cyclase/phosphodiesterase [Gammaproteobacteria bacterium]|nr:bifunctional diguanylate cyclase/phosphodiesterase [Gammaproteobacteria bacterium]
MKKESSDKVVDLNRILKEKESEIELLQQTFTEICSELDLDNVFRIASERARELINAETLLIPLLDNNCETYTYRGGAGKHADEVVGESLPLEFGVCGWVWKNKKPWWQGMLDQLSDDEKNAWEKESSTLILVPLQGKRHFLGGIAGMNKIGGGAFNKKDLNLLQLFASIVSIAIENAMAVSSMEASHRLNDDYRQRLEILNRQLTESSKELEYLSLYDSVTALPNRSLFHDRLTRDINEAQYDNSTIGILLIDIDNFKDINDTLGHDKGDILLNRIARRFEQSINPHETLARLGGDEFIVVLPGHNEAQTVTRAEAFVKSLQQDFNIEGNRIVVNASAGVAVYPEHGNEFSALLKHADVAMYDAKNSNAQVAVYDPASDRLEQGHLSLVSDIRKALEERRFELYYQPKISLDTGMVVAAEALGRWFDSSRGEVSPQIFIDVLENNGLINDYTYWAIDTALAQAKAWQKTFGYIRVAVNVSPQTLMHPDFRHNLDQVVINHDEGRLLTFEITENLFLSEFDRLADLLEHIRSLGIELSIDDYGTGYSSLSLLRRLKVSELKIDQSFVREIVDSRDNEILVHSTIKLAHNLGLGVVAEGVESQEVMDLLVDLGCDTIQGFLISRPLPAGQFADFVRSR